MVLITFSVVCKTVLCCQTIWQVNQKWIFSIIIFEWSQVWILKYKNIEIFEYWNNGIFEKWNIWLLKHFDIEIFKYWNIWIEIFEYWNIWLLQCLKKLIEYWKIERGWTITIFRNYNNAIFHSFFNSIFIYFKFSNIS